tara:strand:- start:965 stop:1093 length:129 start_codon:yes stop_codon:yes gene_type:complete
MPVYLRNFYFNKLAEVKKQEAKEAEKINQKNKQSTSRANIPR